MKTLRPYQENLLRDLESELAKGTAEIVIASCPSSGKTFMMTEFIKQKVTDRFLVLTHGQNILKDMWGKAFLEAGLPASDELNGGRVVYGLPHAFHRKDCEAVDFLIIDEAQHFSDAEMVKTLKKKLKPKHIIYLTGTPSKFIAKGIPTLIIPALDLIPEYISDLYLGLVVTTANLTDDDRTSEGDVLPSGQRLLEKSVNSDLDNLLAGIHNRLRETEFFKANPKRRELVEWAPTLGKLHKTMIACASIKQAEKVEAYFRKLKVNVVSSNSINDRDSENVARFMNDFSVKVLVVVDRGILGFNMEHLVNVVDMTGSRNIDSIYQLYARVMRLHPDHSKKYYFKLAEEGQLDLTKFYMNAALMLMDRNFIANYNGKNLNGCQIAVLKPTKVREEKESSEVSSENANLSRSQGPKYTPIDDYFYSHVTATQFMKTVLSKMGDAASEHAYATFEDIKRANFGFRSTDLGGNKKKIFEFLRENKRRPSLSSKVKEERRLGKLLYAYTCPVRACFDPEFKAQIEALYPTGRDSIGKKAKILEFIHENKRRPKQRSNTLEENKLAKSLSNYICSTSEVFDPEFAQQVEAVCPTVNSVEINKLKILEWIKQTKRKPRCSSKDREEKLLGDLCASYTSKKRPRYDPIFEAQIEALGAQSNQERVYQNFINSMPDNVKLKDGEIWKGINKKHKYIDAEYGEFESMAYSVQQSWKKGLTGHSKRARARIIKCNMKRYLIWTLA